MLSPKCGKSPRASAPFHRGAVGAVVPRLLRGCAVMRSHGSGDEGQATVRSSKRSDRPRRPGPCQLGSVELQEQASMAGNEKGRGSGAGCFPRPSSLRMREPEHDAARGCMPPLGLPISRPAKWMTISVRMWRTRSDLWRTDLASWGSRTQNLNLLTARRSEPVATGRAATATRTGFGPLGMCFDFRSVDPEFGLTTRHVRLQQPRR